MPYRIDEMVAIPPDERRSLESIGIRTTGELIQACASQQGREAVIERTGIGLEQLLVWVHLADLMRIDGVGRQYAELLGESGIDTITTLRRQCGDELAVVLRRVNREKRLAKTTPSLATVGRWVDDARQLPPKVEI